MAAAQAMAQADPGPAVAAAADPDGAAAVALRRLRWHARRGLLENDLLLGRLFARSGAALDAATVAALDCLLDLPDGQLLDLALGRAELEGALDNPPVRAALAMLRAA